MSNNLKIKLIIKKAGIFLPKFFLFVATHAFVVCLFLFLISLFIGFFLFYNCTVLINKTDFREIERPYPLDNKKYENILKNKKEDREKFDLIDFKIYLNPFISTE